MNDSDQSDFKRTYKTFKSLFKKQKWGKQSGYCFIRYQHAETEASDEAASTDGEGESSEFPRCPTEPCGQTVGSVRGCLPHTKGDADSCPAGYDNPDYWVTCCYTE